MKAGWVRILLVGCQLAVFTVPCAGDPAIRTDPIQPVQHGEQGWGGVAVQGGIVIDGVEISTSAADPGVVRGSGRIASVTRTPSSFADLEIQLAADVQVRFGAAPSLVLSGDDNLLPHLQLRVEDGVAVLSSDRSYIALSPLKVTITVPQLRAVAHHGAGAVSLDDVRGAGLALTVEGSADMRASGTVGRLVVISDGSGDMALQDLIADEAEVEITGSGDLRIHVRERVALVLDGSGDVELYGGARITSAEIGGSGELLVR